VYGGRLFTDYRAYKSFFLHGEFEILNTKVPSHATADDASREWGNGALAGIGKTYQVNKKIRGSIFVILQFMYNFLHTEESPYAKPLVIRFGFSLK